MKQEPQHQLPASDNLSENLLAQSAPVAEAPTSNGFKIPAYPRRLWLGLAVAGSILTGTGLVIAQNNVSDLPAPPAMPAPPAGAPLPPDGGPMGERGPARGGPAAGRPGMDGPHRGGPERGPRDGGPRDGGPRDGGPTNVPAPPDGPDGIAPAGGPDGIAPPDGPDGPRPGHPPVPKDANTQEGAARAIERAYRAAGDAGDARGDGREVATAARTFYTQAYQAYDAKNYSKAFQLAEGSHRLSRTAHALDDASDTKPDTVKGLQAPPTVATTDDDAAARELNRNYDEANRAKGYSNAISSRLRSQSVENYRAALSSYNAKKYEDAAQRARLGAEQSKAAREYAEVLAL